MKNELKDYKPIINTKGLENHVIELWFGKKSLYLIRELEKITKLEYNNLFKEVNYIDDNEFILLTYQVIHKKIIVPYYIFDKVNIRYKQYNDYMEILKNIFSFDIKLIDDDLPF
jgi:hypothetical protein